MERKDFLEYDLQTLTYQLSGWYDVSRNCNGFAVTNVGDVDCKVNDQIFYAGVPGTSLGDSRTYGGNRGELYKGKIKVAFASPPVGVAPSIEIVQKVYVNIEGDSQSV